MFLYIAFLTLLSGCISTNVIKDGEKLVEDVEQVVEDGEEVIEDIKGK